MGIIGYVPNYLLHQHKRKILSPTKSLLPSCDLKHRHSVWRSKDISGCRFWW